MRDRYSKSARRRERGVALIMTAIMLVFIVPLIGLSVDAGILYAVQAKLSMACDAGALAGARALSRGTTDSDQVSSAQAVAQEYVSLNFPSNYFGSPAPTVPSPTVDESVTNQRSVNVSATVAVPTYFMRWLNYTTTTVAAAGTATRRDLNVAIVMDRSGSLADTGSCVPLQANAVTFVNQFANLRDNVALVTFATSSKPGGDFTIANNFLTATPTVPTILNELTCTGGTNTAQALWAGYAQLAGLAQSSALNVILLFTDGYPNAMTASFPVLSSSGCSSKTNKLGVMAAGFYAGALTTPVATFGLFTQVATAQPMSSDVTVGPNYPSNNYSNCAYASNQQNVASDIKYIPNSDYYGNAMNTGYQAVTTNSGNINIDPYSLMNAGVNAADSAGLSIRHGAAVSAALPTISSSAAGLSGVIVYCIGLGNAGGVADDLLERIANDPRASNYDSTYPTGLYIYAPTTADLGPAFARVSSEILHISK